MHLPMAASLSAQGLYYANGVALSADESYLIVAETDQIRLVKIWLRGPKVPGWCYLHFE